MSLRILDANLNRAREGLRTCEEYARLALNDTRAAEALKAVRRDVQACAEALGIERLLAARDIAGDVGVRPDADDAARTGPRAVALAGIKRAQEALRVIEEFSRLENPRAAAHAAKARYGAYEAEQQLFVAAPRRAILIKSSIMVVFTRELCRLGWQHTLRELTAAGAKLFQLREKAAGAREFAQFAQAFIDLAPEPCVIINDRADVAALHGAGVHVGSDDLGAKEARRVAGAGAIVGVSTHDVTEALQAQADGADYIGLGTMFPTDSKKVESVAGPELISRVMPRVNLPVFPIGGISPENIAQIARAGATRAAVCGALLKSDKPGAVYHALLQGLKGSR